MTAAADPDSDGLSNIDEGWALGGPTRIQIKMESQITWIKMTMVIMLIYRNGKIEIMKIK